MFKFLNKLVPRSAIVVLLLLTAGAVLAFAAVSHLVTRFVGNQQARGRRLYTQGMADLNAGNSGLAIEEFRAALICDRGNSQYQLTLGRALRDTGRLDEAESYLESLWERTPEDGTINMALARVSVRRGSVDGALRYYHNAIYGVWSSDADANRRRARLELIEFLLEKDALEQARSELLALAAALPNDPALHLRAADLMAQARDYGDALTEYDRVLRLDRGNAAALSGAGQASYEAGRYRTALRFLQAAVGSRPQDATSRHLYESASLILEIDPFARRISDAERNRRVAAAFTAAGERLSTCAKQKGIDLTAVRPAPQSSAAAASSGMATLQSRWVAAKHELPRMRISADTDLPDTIMDLVFDVEQQTAQECGDPHGTDEALLLISRNRDTADQ